MNRWNFLKTGFYEGIKIVGMAFVGLQQVWGVNRGVDRALRGVSERIGNG